MARRAEDNGKKSRKAAERLIAEFNKLKNPRPVPLSKLKEQAKRRAAKGRTGRLATN